MTSRTYARIDQGRVAEVFTTHEDLEALFNPGLVWVDVTSQPHVAEGWLYDGQHLAAPAPSAAPAGPSLAELQEQLQALTARMAAFSAANE